MDASSYKDIITSRGYNKHYYRKRSLANKPALLFVHGWPNTSRDFRRIVQSFQEKGYGIIVPDMLAYGGADKPLDPQEHQYSTLTRDTADTLDAEGVEQAVAIVNDSRVS